MKLAKISAALGFAHLMGLSAAAARAEDDEDKKQQRADESDEDYAKRMEEEDKKDEGDKDEQGAKKAEEGDDGAGDDEKDEAKAKGKAEDEGEEGDKEKAARKSERARCAAIFASPAAGVRPDMAAHLAFNTDMGVKAAVEMLGAIAAGGAAQPTNLASRMAGVKTPNVGASTPAGKQATGSAATANMIIEAGKKRRGEA
jgi:hypothetical protein